MDSSEKKIILIAGGTGLVGSALIPKIDKIRYRIFVLTRSEFNQSHDGIVYINWDYLESHQNQSFKPEIIINLSGAGIADSRWTEKRKNEIIDSRVSGNRKLSEFIILNNYQPEVYISASAIGYYGDRVDEILTEDSTLGNGFLSESCFLWEKSASDVGEKCKRVVILRLGIVMTILGGALPKMLMTKKFRMLNYFGSGKQMQSWIHIDDLCDIFLSSIEDHKFQGKFNAVSPEVISNLEMIHTLDSCHAKKSLIFSVPRLLMKLMLGEMSAIVLDSSNVSVEKLISTGFKFKFPTFKLAYKDILVRKI